MFGFKSLSCGHSIKSISNGFRIISSCTFTCRVLRTNQIIWKSIISYPWIQTWVFNITWWTKRVAWGWRGRRGRRWYCCCWWSCNWWWWCWYCITIHSLTLLLIRTRTRLNNRVSVMNSSSMSHFKFSDSQLSFSFE